MMAGIILLALAEKTLFFSQKYKSEKKKKKKKKTSCYKPTYVGQPLDASHES